MSEIEKLKKAACVAIDAAAGDLATLSKDIWSNPELAFKERHAHDSLTNCLDIYGFQVKTTMFCVKPICCATQHFLFWAWVRSD